MNEQIKEQVRSLIDKSADVCVSSIDADGYPNVKRMFTLPHENYNVYYFSTNVSSMRYEHFKANPRACVYFSDSAAGVQLIGDMEICTDHDTKARFWSDGDEKYYPEGVDDPDYCIFRFTARSGRYYFGGASTDFTAAELA